MQAIFLARPLACSKLSSITDQVFLSRAHDHVRGRENLLSKRIGVNIHQVMLLRRAVIGIGLIFLAIGVTETRSPIEFRLIFSKGIREALPELAYPFQLIGNISECQFCLAEISNKNRSLLARDSKHEST